MRTDLDSDGDSLPLLDSQSSEARPNSRVLEVGELEQIQDHVDKRNLLLVRRVGRLAEERTEDERLSDGGGSFVDVHLADVSGRALERRSERATVDVDVPRDDSLVLAEGEHVEQRRLSSPGRSHERGERSGLCVPLDLVEQLAGSSGHGDRVVEVLPREHGRRLLDRILGRLLVVAVVGRSLLADGLAGDASVLLVGRVSSVGDRRVLALVVRPLEEQVRLLRACSLESLDSKDGQRDQEHPEGEDDADVASEVRVVVLKGDVDVSVAVDERLADSGSLNGADKVAGVGRVARSGRNEGRANAIKVEVVELGESARKKGKIVRKTSGAGGAKSGEVAASSPSARTSRDQEVLTLTSFAIPTSNP